VTANIDDSVLHELATYIEEARWFGGKGRAMRVSGVRRLPWLDENPAPGTPYVRIELMTVEYADGQSELYQVPLAYYSEAQERIAHALVGIWRDEELGEVHAYDALHDRFAAHQWLEAFARRDSNSRPSPWQKKKRAGTRPLGDNTSRDVLIRPGIRPPSGAESVE
jgi:maltokinase